MKKMRFTDTDAVGTLKSNRFGLPQALKEGKLKWAGGGETATKHKDLEKGASLLCMKYKDKKDIYLISTVHKGKIVETAKVNRKKTYKPIREREKKNLLLCMLIMQP